VRPTLASIAAAAVLLGAAGVSHACTYLGPRSADDIKPTVWFERSKNLYLGSIQKIERADGDYVITVAVSESLKGTDQPVVRAKRNAGVVLMCLPLPKVGSNVLVALDSLFSSDEVLPITTEFATTMQKEQKVQSNNTVERDARKSAARPSP
jgi:hypothetical protein